MIKKTTEIISQKETEGSNGKGTESFERKEDVKGMREQMWFTFPIASTLKYLRQFLHEWLSDMH